LKLKYNQALAADIYDRSDEAQRLKHVNNNKTILHARLRLKGCHPQMKSSAMLAVEQFCYIDHSAGFVC